MQKDPEFNLLREEFLKKKCSIKGMIIQNRYKVLDKIGQGAFGKVFKAIDAEKKKFVALKLIDIQKIQEDIRADKIDYVKRMIES